MLQPQGQSQPPGKESLAPVLQQLNLASLRTRTQDLHNAIGRILHTFHTNPSLKWFVVYKSSSRLFIGMAVVIINCGSARSCPFLKVHTLIVKHIPSQVGGARPICDGERGVAEPY